MPKRASGKTHELEEPFDCDVCCRGPAGYDDAARAARGCTRIDLPQVEWDVSAGLLRRGYMGRGPLPPGVTMEEGHRLNPRKPLERLSDGCPGGWYRSRFVWGLDRYMRVRVEGGQRVSNPLLDRCEDDFILQCERLYVQEQERAAAYRVEQSQ